MATIRQRGNRFQAQIRLEGLPAMSKSFKTKKEAEAWTEETEERLRQQRPTEKSEMTLGYLIQRYRDTVAFRLKGYRNSYENVLTAFLREPMCEKLITDITIADFVAYRDKRLNTIKPISLKRQLSTIQSALRVANDEWRITIPNYVALLKFKAKSHLHIRRISTEEREAIRSSILNRTSLSLATRELILDIFNFALETGMRRGEIFRVKPKDYNCKLATLNIPITKTDEPRTIALTETACKIIEKRLHSDPCFQINEETFKTFWQRIVKQTGIEDIRFHDTRHEAISTFFDLGLSTPEVANQSGHKDYKTLARYSHARIQTIVEKLRLAS